MIKIQLSDYSMYVYSSFVYRIFPGIKWACFIHRMTKKIRERLLKQEDIIVREMKSSSNEMKYTNVFFFSFLGVSSIRLSAYMHGQYFFRQRHPFVFESWISLDLFLFSSPRFVLVIVCIKDDYILTNRLLNQKIRCDLDL